MPFEAIIADGGFTGLDYPGLYNQPRLFQYGTNLYQFVGAPLSVGRISVYKSTTLGQTWHHILDVSIGDGGAAPWGTCLVGTSLYIWYTASGSTVITALGFYDFTADTFTVVATTGTITLPNQAANMCLVGPDANHLFAINDQHTALQTIIVSEYLSGVATSIGTMTDAATNKSALQTAFYGASGIVHVLYAGQTTTPNLRYFNINGGSISSPVTVQSTFSDQGIIFGTIATPVQIGSNIYFCFYLPSAQQIKLCSFTDVASPAFTISVIEPTWPITPSPPASTGTGSFVSALFNLTGNLLICFYVNTNTQNTSAVGDGILYCRTSPDAGVTWSPAQQIVQHIDPATTLVEPITAPCAINPVAVTFPFNPLFCSYMQNPNPGPGPIQYARFVPYCPSAVTPPPAVTAGWHSSIE